MLKVRLRTKFLLSLLLVSVGLTCTTLLVVQRTIRKEVRNQLSDDLRNSVLTFHNVQRQREISLTRSAELLANMPTLKALMTTHDTATIQDASLDLWTLAGSNLFALADRSGKIVALHTTTPGFTRVLAQQCLHQSAESNQARHWWFGGGQLYEVFLQPVYFGAASDNTVLGLLAVGYEIDDQVARDISRVAASQVAFRYGDSIITSTLSGRQERELGQSIAARPLELRPADVQLGGEGFLATSVELSSAGEPPVRLSVLKSYDQATGFLQRLHRLLIALGVLAVLVGSALVVLISHRFTRPLKSLVAGVRSLEAGNFAYPLDHTSDDEVAEVTAAFDRMRQNLRTAQQKLLDTERAATIGHMAGSISHDLRHSLTAVMANAEFLCEGGLDQRQREELYDEICVAVRQMTEMIESLLEFSRTRELLRRSYTSLEDIVHNAVSVLRTNPQWQKIPIHIVCNGPGLGWFDPKKLERVFYNLLLNACEAVPPENGSVEVAIRTDTQTLKVSVRDNGKGIPESIRHRLFQPFVSFGKENGTGMGLAVVQKIVQDHGGDIGVESTPGEGTVFRITLPLVGSVTDGAMAQVPGELARNLRAG